MRWRIPADGGGLIRLTGRIGFEVFAAIAIPLLLLMLSAFAGNVIQHRLVWSAKASKPKLDRVSPLAGLKRLFSKHALVNFVKGLLKLALLGTDHDHAAVAGARPAGILHHARSRPCCCRWCRR